MSLRWRSSPRPDQGSLQLIHLPRHETSLRPKSRAPKNCCCASKDTKTLRSVQVDPRGIGALSVHLEHLELGRSIPQEASSLTYSSIATAIDIGIAMLETQHGRRVLRRELGKLWDDVDPGSNKAYVDNFLERMRHDFPWVAVERMSPNVIVAARRLDRLTRGREDSPKRFGIYFNYYGVAAMVQACSQAPKSRAMKLRFHTYLFKFACAIAHEVCTLLMCQSPDSPAGPWTVPGILPGARFDDLLFGGCLKFYGNQGMDASHPGIPHVDAQGVSHQVDPECVRSVVLDRDYTFPLQVTGRSYTTHDRAALRLRNTGDTGANGCPPPSDQLLMTALSERHLRVYDVSESDLHRVPHRLGPLKKAVPVVYVK